MKLGQYCLNLIKRVKKLNDQLLQALKQKLPKKIDLDKDQIIIAASAEWTPGVIGLVASRFVGGIWKANITFPFN